MCLSQSIISFTDGTLHTFFYMTAIITPLFNRILVKTIKTRNIRYQMSTSVLPSISIRLSEYRFFTLPSTLKTLTRVLK